jgi:hypothetical protein
MGWCTIGWRGPMIGMRITSELFHVTWLNWGVKVTTSLWKIRKLSELVSVTCGAFCHTLLAETSLHSFSTFMVKWRPLHQRTWSLLLSNITCWVRSHAKTPDFDHRVSQILYAAPSKDTPKPRSWLRCRLGPRSRLWPRTICRLGPRSRPWPRTIWLPHDLELHNLESEHITVYVLRKYKTST